MTKILIFFFMIFILSCCEEKVEECPCFTENQNPIYKGCTPILDFNDATSCNGGKIIEQIYSQLKYPEQARIDSIQGRVTIAFDIYQDGSVGNFTVVQDTLGYELSEAAIYAAKTLGETGFCPARKNCDPIIYHFILPVLFVLG